MNFTNTCVIHRRMMSTIIRQSNRSRSKNLESSEEAINTPFETQLSSATTRFRDKRGLGLSSATGGTVKDDEVSNTDIMAVGGRLRREKVGGGRDDQHNDRGGSFVATLSATAKHRQKRHNMSEIKQKIPSILSIPVSGDGVSPLRKRYNNTIEQTTTIHGQKQINEEFSERLGVAEEKVNGVGSPLLKLVVGGSVTVTTLSLYFGLVPLF